MKPNGLTSTSSFYTIRIVSFLPLTLHTTSRNTVTSADPIGGPFMQLDEMRCEAVADLSRRILDALKSASRAAQEALTSVNARDPAQILAVTSNTMVDGPSTTAQRFHSDEKTRAYDPGAHCQGAVRGASLGVVG